MTDLPEKVLQFGTGILLRGLPDFFIDKANKAGLFNGRVVVVKSTDGDVAAFDRQGCRFTTFVRGIEKGVIHHSEFQNGSISRVLTVAGHWRDICTAVTRPELQIIISNTTEVGLQYTEEPIFASTPRSFPARLAALLHERYRVLGDAAPTMVVIPTELVPDNGSKLKAMIEKLAVFSSADPTFLDWMNARVIFCSSLVDRIVTLPSGIIQTADALAIQTEPYRLWAIEGDARVREILSFASADDGVIVAPDITYYRERKLRLLNGTHSISVCLGFLTGHNTVFECMEDPAMHAFIRGVMMEEILPVVSLGPETENIQFGEEVLDRFHNPFSEHKLLSIAFQSTMKMRMRNIPTLVAFARKFNAPPPRLTEGFAAWLLFMKGEQDADGNFYGIRHGERYQIQDDEAAWFSAQWNQHDVRSLVKIVCGNVRLWETDLTELPGFEESVCAILSRLLDATKSETTT